MSYSDVGQQRSEYGAAPRAGFWGRFAAALIDGLSLGALAEVLTLLMRSFGYAVAILLGIAYYAYFEGGPRGQTPGKRLLGIRVISKDDGGPIGSGRALIRYFGRILSTIPLYLGYLWMLWDRERQTWHDKLAGAVVVPVADYPPPGGA